MATPEEFLAVIAYLEVGAGTPKTPANRISIYRDLLGNFPGSILMEAARRVLMDHHYPTLPPVGLIAKAATELSLPDVQPVADGWRSVRAFSERWYRWLLDGLPTHDPTLARFRSDLAALPTLARQAADAYGWEAICLGDPGVAFAQFRTCYEGLSRAAQRHAELPSAGAMLDSPLRESLPPAVSNILAGIVTGNGVRG